MWMRAQNEGKKEIFFSFFLFFFFFPKFTFNSQNKFLQISSSGRRQFFILGGFLLIFPWIF